MRRLVAGGAVLAVTALSGVLLAGPASAASAPAPVAAASVPVATFGSPRAGLGSGGVSTQGIDWGNVLRTLNSMAECEALIPLYELRYFPSAIQCLPYKGGTAVMVIVHVSWW